MRGLDGDDLLASGRSGWVGYIQSSHSSPTPILNCAPKRAMEWDRSLITTICGRIRIVRTAFVGQ
jgi:hypothetical protein